MAVVQRAISEKTAKNLLGDRFRQQLKMDGNYTSDAIKFVCTKNDDLTINELVRYVSTTFHFYAFFSFKWMIQCSYLIDLYSVLNNVQCMHRLFFTG